MSITNQYLKFSQALLTWYDSHGRKDLPWQNPRDGYSVWVSEIMLQQTQVKTVIPYFLRFMQHFPNLASLAEAELDQVLALWSGLGYYSRARNLHKTAQIIHYELAGIFPSETLALARLPGIGASTAAAIASQAFERQTAILDANVKRVLCRYFLVAGSTSSQAVTKQLWTLAQACMPASRCADYTQAIMDLGATCCTSRKPNCAGCPVQSDCQARLQSKTAEYPEKKIRKIRPEREQYLLLLDNNGSIYLEQQKATGIWGGLWNLPCCEAEQFNDPQLSLHLQQRFQLRLDNSVLQQPIRHQFSHFTLTLHCKNLKVSSLPSSELAESPGRWFEPAALSKIGLAKPIQSLLAAFIEG